MEKTKIEEKKLYDLNLSQDVVALQCKYTLNKNVINILASMTSEEPLDWQILLRAINKCIERNDCLRLRFVKKDKKLMQYFIDEDKITKVPYYEFATKEEFDEFMRKYRKKDIKYLKGNVIEPLFIKTHEGKDMLLLKVCHLILDVYGLGNLFKDIFAVYEALKNKTELPEKPADFEDVLVEDLKRKFNTEYQEKNKQYFKEFLESHEEPWYAGIHGADNKYWQKRLKKGKRTMQLFLINNQVEAHEMTISKEIMDKVVAYCEKIKESPANFLFYVCSVCASMINNKVPNMLPLELYNCRTTGDSKLCAGTKVQSLACYTTVDYSKSFKENLATFCADQRSLYRHIGFADGEYEALRNSIYGNSMLETFYSITFSFIPYDFPKGYSYYMYSNGNAALPAYIAFLYSLSEGSAIVAYDCHTKTTSYEDVKTFHEKYLKLIETFIDNSNIVLDEVKL